jgi:sigma-E factor negative regulatory protein RseC
MTDIIEHEGIVENIRDSHLYVKVVQASACASCSVKAHCSSADTKEKLIEVTTNEASSYRVGEQVTVYGELSMGRMAVLLAFIVPFFILIIALFLFMSLWHNDAAASLCALALLIPYYIILWLEKGRMKKRFSFSVKPSASSDHS